VCAAATSAQAQPAPEYVLDSLGMRFERNVGQAPSDAQFIAHDSGYDLMLTRGGGVIRGASHRDVRIVFPGSDMTSLPIGEAASPGVVNYLRGNDPSRWHTNIATFDRVRYRRVYPGIDIVYHASQGQMEYDVVLDAGADPKQIRMRFDGAERVALEVTGDLSVHAGDRVLTVKKPVLYQESSDGRQTVNGRFVRLAGGDVGFEVGDYDKRLSLVIDPVLVYSSLLPVGSEGFNTFPHVPAALAVANDGATYIVGTMMFSGGGGFQNDVFVAKVNPSGSTLAFMTYLGGAVADTPRRVALGPGGEIYLTGQTSSWDFPMASAAQPVHGGGADAFLVKLSPTGDALEYATFIGGTAAEDGEGLVVDPDANAYLVGTTSSANFPVLSSLTAFGGNDDAFAVKYDSSGNKIFALLLGGTFFDRGHAAALAPDGTLLVAGEASSVNFPVTPGAYDITSSATEGFVTRLRPSDGLILQSTFLGGSSTDSIRGIDTDPSGAVYVTGETLSQDFPTTPGAVQPSAFSSFNAFISKLSVNLDAVAYATYLGSSGSDRGFWIAVDDLGQATVAGPTTSAVFPQFSPLYSTTSSNVPPSFITKVSADGSQFRYSTFWPAALTALTSGPSGDVYIAGTVSFSYSEVYPTTPNALVPSLEGSSLTAFARISDASPTCSYDLPSPILLSSLGSPTPLAVVAPSECFWTITSSDPSWLTTTPNSGTGTRTITLVSQALGSPVSRSATLTVGNGAATAVTTVHQQACAPNLPSIPKQPAAGGSIVLNVTGAAGCVYAVKTDSPWVTIEPALGVLDGAGKGQLTLTLLPNPFLADRIAYVRPDPSRSVELRQAARCTATLSSSSLTMHYTGATTSVSVAVAPPDCQWTAQSDSQWLASSISAATGSQTVTITAAPGTASRSGHIMLAGQILNVHQSGPSPTSSAPVVYPPQPPSGSGHSQTFTFTFLNVPFATNLSVVNVLINSFLDGTGACYLAYDRAGNVLYLVNDAGDGLLPGMVLDGGTQTIGNSQCEVDGYGSSATISGNLLTLRLTMAFSAQFAGNKVVYQAARNIGGFNSGWVQQGVWNVPPPIPESLQVVSMTPGRNSGSGYPFQFTYRNLAGAEQLVSTTVLINGYLDGFGACYVGYHVPTNSLLLLNDAGNGYVGGIVLGTNATIENSQCRINGQQSGAEVDGTDLRLTLTIAFKAGFAGNKVFYVSAQDGVGTSGWQAVGSWSVP